ncbi:hypothetical protein Tco_0110406 [Tanacetum coccineum]
MEFFDTPGVSVSKKKSPATTHKRKGNDLLSEAALLEDAQMKKVLDELKGKTTGTNEGIGTIPGVPDVPKDQSESEYESWGESRDDDDSNDDDNDDVSDDDDSDDNGNNNASDDERTESDDDQNNDDKEEYDDEYVRTPSSNESTDDENEQVDEEVYDRIDEELYKDVNTTYNQVKDDAHVTLSVVHDTQKTEVPLQSSFVSSDFATQFLNLDNIPPADNEIISMMNVNVRHEEPSNQTPSLLTIPVTVIPETSTVTTTTIPLHIPPFTPLPKLSPPTPTPTPIPTKTSIPALPDFSSLFNFNQRVSNLEKELLRDSIQKAIRSYTLEFEKGAQAEKKRYIDLIEKSVKDIINDEVKTQLPQILPNAVSDFITPVIKSTITESLKDVVLGKPSSQPQSTYEAAASLIEFELKKIISDKMQKSQSYRGAKEHEELYDGLVKSYKLDKDLFKSYGKAYSLKRGHEDNDKDEDPLTGSDQGMKRRKTSKDVESSKGSKSRESKSISSSKGTICSQPKSSGKYPQAEEPIHTVDDAEVQQNQGQDMGNTDDQPNVEAASKYDWFKKPERTPTPDPDWNVGKSVDFKPPQTWISKIAQAEKPPLSFEELMSTPIDFSEYVLNHLKIDNLTQEHLVGLVFNLLKGTCISRVKLEYNILECYKAVIDRLDWNNPEGKKYMFDLNKPLPLIMDRDRQVVPFDYFINNNLEYLRGGSSSKKYMTSTTKTKAAKYDIQGIKDMVPSLWSPVKEGDFLRLHLHDIEDMLLLLVQKKLSNLERDVIFDLGVALRMFTRRIVILKHVEDLQLGVESYQKKLNITKPKTFKSDISNKIPYTAYNNPQGIIYKDKYKRNRLMRTDELYKFSDGTLTSVRSFLHDIASNLRMDYLPKRRWISLDRKRSCIMIKAIHQQLLERRLMRSLEKFVGGRDYGEDLRLLQRTI